jgi:hypothetical protein
MNEGQVGVAAPCCLHSAGAIPSGSSLSVSHTLALLTTAFLQQGMGAGSRAGRRLGGGWLATHTADAWPAALLSWGDPQRPGWPPPTATAWRPSPAAATSRRRLTWR